MCYDPADRPPDPPGSNETATGRDLQLSTPDGNRFAAFLAEPSSPTGAQLLIYPDVRGLHGFYKELARHFAEAGVRAIAIDYFGRTAGIGARDEPFEYRPHVNQLALPSVFADARAALDHLRQGGHAGAPTFVLGFCMGGGLALLSGTQDLGLAGLVAFYAGIGREWPGTGTALEQAHNIRCPVLGLFGGSDPAVPVEQVEKLDQELDRAGVEHEIVIYPGAPHSFFDRKQAEFAGESEDAWKRALAFIAAHAEKAAAR